MLALEGIIISIRSLSPRSSLYDSADPPEAYVIYTLEKEHLLLDSFCDALLKNPVPSSRRNRQRRRACRQAGSAASERERAGTQPTNQRTHARTNERRDENDKTESVSQTDRGGVRLLTERLIDRLRVIHTVQKWARRACGVPVLSHRCGAIDSSVKA